MTSNPVDKWFWNDWDNDLGLKACSFAAQGLWMRMLSICARAEPRGHLRIEGRQCTLDDLCAVVGKPVEVVEPLVAELEKWGVFNCTRKGTIYNRRMLRGSKVAKMNAKKGKKGGHATYSKQTGIFARTGGGQEPCQEAGSPPLPLTPYPNKEGKELLGNTESESEDPALNERVPQRGTNALRMSVSNGVDLDVEFEEWWACVWRKRDKGHARKAYVLVRRKGKATRDELFAGRDAYKREAPDDPTYQCYPATWLTTASAGKTKPSRPATSAPRPRSSG